MVDIPIQAVVETFCPGGMMVYNSLLLLLETVISYQDIPDQAWR